MLGRKMVDEISGSKCVNPFGLIKSFSIVLKPCIYAGLNIFDFESLSNHKNYKRVNSEKQTGKYKTFIKSTSGNTAL